MRSASIEKPSQNNIRKPCALKKGDTVGIVAPSSPAFEAGNLTFATDWLQKLGIKYKLGTHIGKSYSSYAGDDQARAEDFQRLWDDDEVSAILPLRGGAGATRLLPLLDFSLFARKPKILVGFSDITALLVAIHQQSNLVTFHGPTLGLMFETAYTHAYYQKAVMSISPLGAVSDPPLEPWGSEYPPRRLVIAPGKGRGRLTGGCLTLIRGLMGTPYEMETAGRIVFLEDVDEEPHNIDRMLSQLVLAGKFDNAAGIIIGDCSGCRPGGSKRSILPLNMSVEAILKERLGKLGIPVIFGLKFGHTADKITLPLGVMASLDTAGGASNQVRFDIEEAACVDKTAILKK